MGLGRVAIATLPSVIFPKLMFSDRLGGVEMFIIFACVNPVRTASTGTFMLGAILIY